MLYQDNNENTGIQGPSCATLRLLTAMHWQAEHGPAAVPMQCPCPRPIGAQKAALTEQTLRFLQEVALNEQVTPSSSGAFDKTGDTCDLLLQCQHCIRLRLSDYSSAASVLVLEGEQLPVWGPHLAADRSSAPLSCRSQKTWSVHRRECPFTLPGERQKHLLPSASSQAALPLCHAWHFSTIMRCACRGTLRSRTRLAAQTPAPRSTSQADSTNSWRPCTALTASTLAHFGPLGVHWGPLWHPGLPLHSQDLQAPSMRGPWAAADTPHTQSLRKHWIWNSGPLPEEGATPFRTLCR